MEFDIVKLNSKDTELIENIMFRIFEKIAIMTYPLGLRRKKNNKDGDIQYFVVLFTNILFGEKFDTQDVICIWNSLLGKEKFNVMKEYMYARVNDKELEMRLGSIILSIENPTKIRNRIDKIITTSHIKTEIKGNSYKIRRSRDRILSRFKTAIFVAPRLTHKSNILEIDYIIYILFFNVIKMWCLDKKGNAQENVLGIIQKHFGDAIILNDFEKKDPCRIDKGSSELLDAIIGNKSIYFNIADFIYGTKGDIKNSIISDLIDKKSKIFLKKF